jgi:hypothetical protein
MASKRQKNKEKSTISGTESLTMKSRLSAQSLTPLIKSVTSDFEAKLLLQDGIDGIVRESEAFISYRYCMASPEKRSKLLSSYRQFLKDMISDVDMVLKKK